MWRPVRHKMYVNYQEADASCLYENKHEEFLIRLCFGYLKRTFLFTEVPKFNYISWINCCLSLTFIWLIINDDPATSLEAKKRATELTKKTKM